MSNPEAKPPSAFDERLREGRPLMQCVIDIPFKVEVVPTGVQIDAPCLEFNHTDALGVLRVTLSPQAALNLRNVLNQLSFSEVETPGSKLLQ